MCHYFVSATIFLVTPDDTCERRTLLERAAGIIHVAFVFVKTLTKRCFPTWRPFNLHFAAVSFGITSFSRDDSSLSFSLSPFFLLPRVALSRTPPGIIAIINSIIFVAIHYLRRLLDIRNRAKMKRKLLVAFV